VTEKMGVANAVAVAGGLACADWVVGTVAVGMQMGSDRGAPVSRYMSAGTDSPAQQTVDQMKARAVMVSRSRYW
jgi:hypothetical protein